MLTIVTDVDRTFNLINSMAKRLVKTLMEVMPAGIAFLSAGIPHRRTCYWGKSAGWL